MRLDTHLYNLLQQYFDASSITEKQRLQELALTHLEQRDHVGRAISLGVWETVVDAFQLKGSS
jgi:hypothetical protein